MNDELIRVCLALVYSRPLFAAQLLAIFFELMNFPDSFCEAIQNAKDERSET